MAAFAAFLSFLASLSLFGFDESSLLKSIVFFILGGSSFSFLLETLFSFEGDVGSMLVLSVDTRLASILTPREHPH